MRRLLSILAVTMLVVLPSAHAYFPSTWYDGADGWRTAARQSKVQGVPMFVYFRVDWCPHCKAFDELLQEPEVRRALAGVIKVVVNPEDGEEERRLFSEAYGGTGYPTLFLHPPGGTPKPLSPRGPAERFIAQLPR